MLAMLALCAIARPPDAHAFCGFYVGKADSNLFNHASQVVMVRHDDKTVLSLMNDYQGEPSDFALVVPVPEVLQKEQIHIGDREIFKKLDQYSSPRLVEYFDPNPCEIYSQAASGMGVSESMKLHRAEAAAPRANAFGVTIEAQYTVGEYDIVILSAKQSDGLETWLQENGYKIPVGAHRALEPYIRQDMKFFVAKVNLKEHQATGLSYLRPIQFAFESPKFMLPIRLGMINAQGPQDLIVYALTEDGRVETTNYRTEKLPTGENLPEYVQPKFQDFYKAMFDKQVNDNAMRAVFTEYVWNMGWCDPCAGPPLSREELRSLGVFWLDEAGAAQCDALSASAGVQRRSDAGDADAAARAIHGRQLSRGPRVSGNRRPGELPGALCPPASVEGVARGLRGGRQLFQASPRARKSRGPDACGPHRMGSGRHHEKCRPDRATVDRAMVEGVVGLTSNDRG